MMSSGVGKALAAGARSIKVGPFTYIMYVRLCLYQLAAPCKRRYL